MENVGIPKLPLRWMDQLVRNFEDMISFAEDNNLTNEQDFLDFLDKMNKLSVKH